MVTYPTGENSQSEINPFAWIAGQVVSDCGAVDVILYDHKYTNTTDQVYSVFEVTFLGPICTARADLQRCHDCRL